VKSFAARRPRRQGHSRSRLHRHQGLLRGARQEDDVTLVVAKVGERREPAQDYVI
jgi:hypothetical protein